VRLSAVSSAVLRFFSSEVALVLAYIAGDVAVFAAMDAAGHGYSRESAMLCSAVVCLATAALASCLADGLAGLCEALQLRHWARRLPVAASFSLAIWSQLHAVARLNSVLVKVLFQLKLPCTVLMSTVVLQQSYNSVQVHALITNFLAVTAFTCIQAGQTEDLLVVSVPALLGYVFSFAAVGFNVVAGLLAEKAFKASRDVSFYATVVHLKVGEALVALALMSLVPRAPLPLSLLLRDPLAMFAGFDAGVWRVVLALVVDSWLSAVIVKRLSSVVKAVAKGVSLVTIYALSVRVLKTEAFRLEQMILAMLIVNGTCLFTAYDSEAKVGNCNGEAGAVGHSAVAAKLPPAHQEGGPTNCLGHGQAPRALSLGPLAPRLPGG